MASANAYTRHQSRRRQKIVEARTPGVIQTNGLDVCWLSVSSVIIWLLWNTSVITDNINVLP